MLKYSFFIFFIYCVSHFFNLFINYIFISQFYFQIYNNFIFTLLLLSFFQLYKINKIQYENNLGNDKYIDIIINQIQYINKKKLEYDNIFKYKYYKKFSKSYNDLNIIN